MDRKRALVCFPHGIGDVIQATPAMRALYNEGYILDMMVRRSVINSHLLDDCPYIDKLILARTDITENGWKQFQIPHFNKLRDGYDRAIVSKIFGIFKHRPIKIADDFKVKPTNYHLEVWINRQSEQDAAEFVRVETGDSDFVHVHTKIEVHPKYWWHSLPYVMKNYPRVPILDSGYCGNAHKRFANINTTFAIMKKAKYRVLSLSVMAAAADALDLPIDLLNSVIPRHNCLPMNKKLVKKLRVEGKIK